MTVVWVDCRCFLPFVFHGGARRLELSPCNTSSGESVLSLCVCENLDGWLVAWGLCGYRLIHFSTVWLLPFTPLQTTGPRTVNVEGRSKEGPCTLSHKQLLQQASHRCLHSQAPPLPRFGSINTYGPQYSYSGMKAKNPWHLPHLAAAGKDGWSSYQPPVASFCTTQRAS